MAAQSRAQATVDELESGLLGQIEVHSIDWIPDPERHGKNWQQSMLWFLGNFQHFTIPIGFGGPSLGLSLGWTILAGAAGIAAGTLFMAFHATQGPIFGLPQMIQTRAQLGYRGVVVALFAVLFTYMAFNVADQVLMSTGLHGAFGWNAGLVAIATAVLAALLAIFGYDWVEIPFMVLPPIAGFSYTGWFPNHVTNGVDYSWLVGLAVSGLVYWLACRSLDVSAEQSAIDASERELRAIDAIAAQAAES